MKIPSKQILFIKVNYRGDEIYDGLIGWNNDMFYFKFENGFDNGNRYLVFDKSIDSIDPVAYFSILTTPDDESEEDIYMGDVEEHESSISTIKKNI
ncbi:hypothetical protein D4R86_02230 [bacterium]|nr:MAG: hypothetical protein D4R86_02230 [bacterium]